MTTKPAVWKISLVVLSLLITGAGFYYFQHRDSPEHLRVEQFIETCQMALGSSDKQCQEMLERWGDFFNR